MLQFIENLLQVEKLSWVLFSITWMLMLFVIVLFLIHRRNNKAIIMRLEEKMHERDNHVFSRTVDELEHFKKALMVHLSEIGERIKGNEVLTNKVMNMVDALREAIEEMDEKSQKV